MKGFIIFEDFKKLINCKEILDGDYNCVISDYPNGTFSGIINRVTGARCNKDDTYDFETGALIALMKMCGVEKVKKAAKETFFEVAENAVNEYEEEIKKLREEIIELDYRKTCNETTIELLYNTINALKGIDDKYKELKEENKMLCDKIKFLDKENRNLIYGGRQNGKQYTFLSNLFKGMPKDKVDAAYKEAYDKWIKLPSPRERMWDDILKEGRTPVYVKREDIHAFLEECQVTGIKWATGKMPLETMPFHMCKGYDGIYFFVMTTLDISKSTPGVKEFRHVMCWWMTASDEEARNSVKYIAPMRWDLFKKGRLAVKVTYNNYKEFYDACERELGKKPSTYLWDNDTISICKKDGNFEIFTIEHQKKTGRKIVNWEDVR